MDKQPNLLNIGFSKSLELALNTAIDLDEQQGTVFDPLNGKVVQIHLVPFEDALFCLINNRQVSIQHRLTGAADVAISIQTGDLIGLPLGKPLAAEITSGDQALGHTFINALNSLEIDWEEQLSHFTGDLVAFKVGHGVRSVLQTRQEIKGYMAETIKEYLLFEIETLPPRHKVDRFNDDVRKLSQAVDQIAERIAKLTEQTSNPV